MNQVCRIIIYVSLAKIIYSLIIGLKNKDYASAKVNSVLLLCAIIITTILCII